MLVAGTDCTVLQPTKRAFQRRHLCEESIPGFSPGLTTIQQLSLFFYKIFIIS
jgi:hypothetical protein